MGVDVKKQKQKIPKRNNFISLQKMSFARKIVSSGLISKCMKSQNSTKFKFLQPQLLSVPNLRSMFIQTQDTPNPQSLKFLPGIKFLDPISIKGVWLQKLVDSSLDSHLAVIAGHG